MIKRGIYGFCIQETWLIGSFSTMIQGYILIHYEMENKTCHRGPTNSGVATTLGPALMKAWNITGKPPSTTSPRKFRLLSLDDWHHPLLPQTIKQEIGQVPKEGQREDQNLHILNLPHSGAQWVESIQRGTCEFLQCHTQELVTPSQPGRQQQHRRPIKKLQWRNQNNQVRSL